MIPSMNVTLKSAKDLETFVFMKTDQQMTQVNMMTVRGYHAGMLMRAKQAVREEESKLKPTKWGVAVKSVFDNTVTWIDPASEFTYYESSRAWELMRHSVDVPVIIRNHIEGLIRQKKLIGKGDFGALEAFRRKACEQMWLDLVQDRREFEDFVQFNLDMEFRNGSDVGWPAVPSLTSKEMIEVTRKSNTLTSQLAPPSEECAVAVNLTPSIFRNDEMLDDIIDLLEQSSRPIRILKFNGLKLADENKMEHRVRARYFLNKIDVMRQSNANRFFIASECGYQAYPFALYGFDSINTSMTGFDRIGGGRFQQKRFVGYSAYFVKEDLVHVPYERVHDRIFPYNGKLPHDCRYCNPVTDLDGITREYWNNMVARPHYATVWNELLTEMSDFINTNKVHKAKERLMNSELCSLKKLIPDV